jgi:hypothetical protein
MLRVGEDCVRVATEPDRPVRTGDTVHLEPRADRIRWFDAESREAITS